MLFGAFSLYAPVLKRSVDVNYINSLDGFAEIDKDGLIVADLDGGTTRITDSNLFDLLAVDQYRELRLSNSSITDIGLSQIGNAWKLEVLVLDNCKGLSDRGIRSLAKLKGLKKLSLRGTLVSEERIEQLKLELPNVEIVCD